MARSDMGIGLLGSNTIIIKRPNRFTFRITPKCGAIDPIPEHYVKEVKRPNINQSEIKLNFLNEQTYIPGRITYDTVDVSYIDVANDVSMTNLYKWLAQNFRYNDNTKKQGSSRNDYSATGILITYDGCGNILDTFVYNDLWPTKVTFGDMKYDSDSEPVMINITCRYTSINYFPNCPNYQFPLCCTGCG